LAFFSWALFPMASMSRWGGRDMKFLPLNFALMRNPLNWATVTAMAFIGALFFSLISNKDISDHG
jgi:hypothetical protein